MVVVTVVCWWVGGGGGGGSDGGVTGTIKGKEEGEKAKSRIAPPPSLQLNRQFIYLSIYLYFKFFIGNYINEDVRTDITQMEY